MGKENGSVSPGKRKGKKSARCIPKFRYPGREGEGKGEIGGERRERNRYWNT